MKLQRGRQEERERKKEFRDWWDNLTTTLYFCTWDRHDLEIMQICRDRLRRWRGTKENSAIALKRCRLVEQNYANLSWNADLYWAVIIVIILHSFTFRGLTWVKKKHSAAFLQLSKDRGSNFFLPRTFGKLFFHGLTDFANPDKVSDTSRCCVLFTGWLASLRHDSAKRKVKNSSHWHSV